MNSEKRLEEMSRKEILNHFIKWLLNIPLFAIGNIHVLIIPLVVAYPLQMSYIWITISFLFFVIDLKDKIKIMKYVS